MNLFETSGKSKAEKIELPDADVTFYKDFFTNEESKRLYKNISEKINWQQDQIKIYGKTIDLPRLTAWYGENINSYSYSGIHMNTHSWIEELLFIKKRIEQETKINFTNVLLNFYRDGKNSVSWHADDEKELGKNPIIASVSLGGTRLFQLRHRFDKKIKRITIPLSGGSFLLMKGTTQHFWQHRVPKTLKQTQPRINLTFRVIK